MAALAKKLIKPSRAPVRSWKDSLRRFLSSMTAVMSTSLKVVSIAAVCWASTSRWAIVWRRRVMRMRSSRPPSGGGGRGNRRRRRRGGRLGLGLALGGGHDVVAGDAASGTGADDGCQIEVVLLR